MSDPAILQYEAWKDIIQSPGWSYFRDLIKEHIDFLDNKTCIAVKNEKFNEAMKYQAKSEDWKKIIDLIDKRIKELEEVVKNGHE